MRSDGSGHIIEVALDFVEFLVRERSCEFEPPRALLQTLLIILDELRFLPIPQRFIGGKLAFRDGPRHAGCRRLVIEHVREKIGLEESAPG